MTHTRRFLDDIFTARHCTRFAALGGGARRTLYFRIVMGHHARTCVLAYILLEGCIFAHNGQYTCHLFHDLYCYQRKSLIFLFHALKVCTRIFFTAQNSRRLSNFKYITTKIIPRTIFRFVPVRTKSYTQ